MSRGVLLALLVCIVMAGGVAADSGSGHIEPKNVIASCGSDSATVSWSVAGNSDPIGFNVFEKAAGENAYSRANSQLVTTMSYLVTGLLPATTYSFGVTAVYGDGESSEMSTPAMCATA